MLNLNNVKEEVIVNYAYFIKRVKDAIGNDTDYIFADSEAEMTRRIENLIIEKASIFDSSIEDYKYNGLQNTIIVNKKYLERKDIFLDNLYMDMALSVAFYNPRKKISGFGTENFEALNKGMREMLTLSLVGECRSTEYFESDEYVFTNLMCQMVNTDLFEEAFFYNEPSLFMEEPAIKNNIDLFSKINMLANHNMKSRLGKRSISELDEIQYQLFTLFTSTNPSKENLESFLANTVSNSMVFKDKEKYKRLDRLDFDDMYKDYLLIQESSKRY